MKLPFLTTKGLRILTVKQVAIKLKTPFQGIRIYDSEINCSLIQNLSDQTAKRRIVYFYGDKIEPI